MAGKKKPKRQKPKKKKSQRKKKWTGASARTKGHAFERFCAQKLRKLYPDAKRHLESQFSEAQGFDLDGIGPFRFQCKAYSRYAPIAKIKEVQHSADNIPGLITKGDNLEPVVCIYLEDFIKILGDIGEAFVGVKPITEDDF